MLEHFRRQSHSFSKFTTFSTPVVRLSTEIKMFHTMKICFTLQRYISGEPLRFVPKIESVLTVFHIELFTHQQSEWFNRESTESMKSERITSVKNLRSHARKSMKSLYECMLFKSKLYLCKDMLFISYRSYSRC